MLKKMLGMTDEEVEELSELETREKCVAAVYEANMFRPKTYGRKALKFRYKTLGTVD